MEGEFYMKAAASADGQLTADGRTPFSFSTSNGGRVIKDLAKGKREGGSCVCDASYFWQRSNFNDRVSLSTDDAVCFSYY